MANWQSEIENEMFRAADARKYSHEGRLRTSARRIAGIALSEYRRAVAGIQNQDSFIVLLDECALDPAKPDNVRDAARRLETRVGFDRTSPSTDPIGDAEIIVAFVRSAVQNS